MNSLEDFKTLVQIQSIENIVFKHRENIENFNKRIEQIKKQKSNASLEKEEIESKNKTLSESIRSREKELAVLEQELNQAKGHIQDISNQKQENAINTQIKSLAPKASQLENQILLDMELCESYQSQINQKDKFLMGIDSSIEEITKEVNASIEKEDREIEIGIKRRKNLLSSVSPEFKNIYLNLKKRFIGTSALSFLKNKNCSQCGMHVDNVKEANIEVHNTLETCITCGRLLMPTSSKA